MGNALKTGVLLVLLTVLFVAIGMLSLRQKQETGADYLLAGHSVKPWLVALSAVATNNSGYMFIGVIGYTYVTGLPAIWLMVVASGLDASPARLTTSSPRSARSATWDSRHSRCSMTTSSTTTAGATTSSSCTRK